MIAWPDTSFGPINLWNAPLMSKTKHTPNYWVVVNIQTTEATTSKILAGWNQTSSKEDHWKLSSEIAIVEEFKNRFQFYNTSGSLYVCYKNKFGFSMYTASIYEKLEETLEASSGNITINKRYRGIK